MANRRVRLIRSLKINGKPVQCAPEISAKGTISPEYVFYKGERLKFPVKVGRWCIRWEEGSKPRWSPSVGSMTEA